MEPTDRTRERTLAQLREGYASGSLATGTFDRRIDVALRSSTREELRSLTLDLPAQGGRRRRAERAVRAWLWPEAGSEPHRSAVERAGLDRRQRPRHHEGLLAAAELAAGHLTLGRSQRCELVLTDDTVSRRHATLELREGRWFLVDLGSSNGTWVNDRRVFDAEVLPGDEIRLGAVRLRL